MRLHFATTHNLQDELGTQERRMQYALHVLSSDRGGGPAQPAAGLPPLSQTDSVPVILMSAV